MSISAVEPERAAVAIPETPGGRLHSALDVVKHIVGGSACAVAWLDAWSSVRSAGVGEGEAMEATLRTRLVGDEPAVDAALVWMTTLEDREGETVGLLAVDVEPPESAWVQLAAATRHVGLLLDTSRLEAGRTAAYEALVDVSSRIQVEELKTDEILGLITRQARRLMEVDVTWLALLDEERDRVVVKVAAGARTDTFVRMWVSVGVGLGGMAVRDRRPVIVRDHRTSNHPTTDLVRETIDAEGIVSLICVPMVFDGRVVGALYGGSREATDFTELAASVFAALAGQAAAAIVHSRLYRDLEAKNDTLLQALTMHQSLSAAALEGGGVDSIAGELARVLEREVRVEREGAVPRTVSYSPEGECAAVTVEAEIEVDAEDPHVAPIAAGSDRLGTVHAQGAEPMSDLEQMALRQGATVIALEILRERAALEAEWRLRGDLLEEIIQADGEWSEGLQVRAGQLGIDLDRPRALAVLEPIGAYEPHDLELLLRVVLHRDLENQTAIVTMRGERVLIAFAFEQERAASLVGTLLEKAQAAGMSAVAGVSNPRGNLSIALKEANAALRLASAAGPGSHVAHDGGPLRFLLDAPDTGEMTAMVRDLLGPIARRDSERGTGEILSTLKAYLDTGNRPDTAERCHVHVSTVKYRMQRAAELLGRELSDPRVRFELQLAFQVRETLMTLGIDPLAGLPDAKADSPRSVSVDTSS
jgi:DNA-binding PucR family transcriptional regulator